MQEIREQFARIPTLSPNPSKNRARNKKRSFRLVAPITSGTGLVKSACKRFSHNFQTLKCPAVCSIKCFTAITYSSRKKCLLERLVQYDAKVTLVNVFLTLAPVASVYFKVVNQGGSIKHEQRLNTTCPKWLHT